MPRARDGQPLFTEERLLRLARLPWFRHGKMPDWLRLELIDGTEVDFIKEGLNEAFRFRNPNISGECGCGESFSV